MIDDPFKFSKEDLEVIALGLSEYVNYVNHDKNGQDYKDIQQMLTKLDSYLKKD